MLGPHYSKQVALVGTMALTATALASSASARKMTTSTCEAKQDDKFDFWKDKWDKGATGWHKDAAHPFLSQFLEEKKLLSGSSRVLVPLCGKTLDMTYLTQQAQVKQVVGVELVEKALAEFAQENKDLNIHQQPASGAFNEWIGDSILLLQGDFFKLNPRTGGGKFDMVWDRAALVAIEPSMRQDYVAVLGSVLTPGGHILLATYEHGRGDGPPHSIGESMVRQLFEAQPWVESVEVLKTQSAFANEPWYKAFVAYFMFGSSAKEHLILIKAKQ